MFSRASTAPGCSGSSPALLQLLGYCRAVNFKSEIAFGPLGALASCHQCKAGKAHQSYDGPQALTVKQQAFNLLNTGQYRGGSPISGTSPAPACHGFEAPGSYEGLSSAAPSKSQRPIEFLIAPWRNYQTRSTLNRVFHCW